MSSEASFFQPSKLTYKEKHSLPDRLVIGPWQKLEMIIHGTGPKPELVHGAERKFDEIAITGESDFVEGIARALALMRNKAPGFYQVVSGRVKRISQAKINGAGADVSKGEVLCGSDLIEKRVVDGVNETDIWPAGVIAHEAKHIDLYERRLPFYGDRGEIVTTKFQVFALSEMGASGWTVQRTDWSRSALESPWHKNKPGVRWWK